MDITNAAEPHSNAPMQPIKLAFYDMDKTLTKRATYNFFLWHMMIRRAPWRVILLPLLPIGLMLFGLKIWDRKQLKSFSLRICLGHAVRREEITQYLESHAELVLARNIYPQALARLQRERAEGYIHILVTASYRLYAASIAHRLGIAHVIATDLHTDEKGRILAHIDGENCYDMVKISRIEEWMRAQGYARQNCFVRSYSDHYSDAPLLEYADEAFAVNPHPRLAKLAAEKGWSVIDWR